MRPRFFPSLVNGAFGDPALYVDFLQERRAMLFDLGDIGALAPRAVLRVSDVFVSHAHMDHFIGFDRLLRLLVGRRKTLRLFGPAGFLDRVEAKLGAYTWNLAGRFRDDLVFRVTEIRDAGSGACATFRLRTGFRREDAAAIAPRGGVLLREPSLSVRASILDHRTPCLAFALQESRHVNVWRTRLEALGLVPGPWLADLKRAVHAGLPDDTPVTVAAAGGATRPGSLPLGFLKREILSITPGQKVAYVTDAAGTTENARAIAALAAGAHTLFIEAPFAASEKAIAAARAHLTTAQAGRIARAAGAARVEPFHFSPRHAGAAAALRREVQAAFRASPAAPEASGRR